MGSWPLSPLLVALRPLLQSSHLVLWELLLGRVIRKRSDDFVPTYRLLLV